jgi:alkanesulfonate monooxygenase SsuD/methylene tetrahydromethanopterin reductase-like flavin-dependent oxidoreductase (luciferase family)
LQTALALAAVEPHRGACTRIEASGFAGIWVGDPLGRTLDPLTELAALAAATATLRDSAAHVADLHGT